MRMVLCRAQTSREDAAAAAQAQLQEQWAPPAQPQGADASSLGLDTYFVYHSRSGNMLTAANLAGMRTVRASVQNTHTGRSRAASRSHRCPWYHGNSP